MAGVVHGVAGLAVSASAHAPPPPAATPHYGGYYPPSPPVPTHYHANSGTHSIQGDLRQDGTFKGHGTGAKIQGGFSASGDIQCGQPAAEGIFSEFCLLLTDEPVAAPDIIDLGVIYGKDIYKTDDYDDDDNDALVDLDDRLHFPPEEKEIDISKNVRDRIHLEITINAICDPKCKGLCLKCGTNLNTSNCNCSREEIKEKGFGPLGNLKEQLQR